MPTATSPLDELSDAAESAKLFYLEAEFDLPKGSLIVRIAGHSAGKKWVGYVGLSEFAGGRQVWHPSVTAATPQAALKAVPGQFPGAVLRPGTVKVQVTRGPTTGAKLLPVAIQAWHEAFGLPVPTPDEVARSLKAARADKKKAAGDAAADLKTGPAGVKKFNRIPFRQRVKMKLRKADLANLDLAGVKFGGVDLTDADLSGAKLAGAKFQESGTGLYARATLKGAKLVEADLSGVALPGCHCGGADFTRADLTAARASGANFRDAMLTGANLTDADLKYADLRGADLTGATLAGNTFTGATFDEKTKWPKGYELPPPDQLKWKGVGPDPRLAPTKREKKLPPPADFSGFLDRLKKATDAAKLDKAMAMLKADSFRLFARVNPDHLVGVVKSQSDPSLVYSCRLGSDGKYACCTQNLNVCGGLRGSPCKHLLVLMVGLAKAGELDPATAHAWTQASRGQKPELDKDAMTETFLQYKGAEAGEIDWRPTETIPEDFYAV